MGLPCYVPAGLLAAVLLSLAVGCGGSTESLTVLRDAVQQASHQSQLQCEDAADVDNQSIESDHAEFTCPFPDREDPFAFPDGVEQNVPQGPTGDTAAGVTVLGFADVGQPRVLLQVNDHTRMLAVGDQTAGIEVVSIHRPAVQLRSGNLEWTASMFDHGKPTR